MPRDNQQALVESLRKENLCWLERQSKHAPVFAPHKHTVGLTQKVTSKSRPKSAEQTGSTSSGLQLPARKRFSGVPICTSQEIGWLNTVSLSETERIMDRSSPSPCPDTTPNECRTISVPDVPADSSIMPFEWQRRLCLARNDSNGDTDGTFQLQRQAAPEIIDSKAAVEDVQSLASKLLRVQSMMAQAGSSREFVAPERVSKFSESFVKTKGVGPFSKAAR